VSNEIKSIFEFVILLGNSRSSTEVFYTYFVFRVEKKYREMVELKAVLSDCIIAASNLKPTLDSNRYLAALSDVSSENNYEVFRAFACASSDTLLAVLYRLGHFNGYDELLHIAGEIVEMREAFGHKEEDAGGHISFLLLNHRGRGLEVGKKMI